MSVLPEGVGVVGPSGSGAIRGPEREGGSAAPRAEGERSRRQILTRAVLMASALLVGPGAHEARAVPGRRTIYRLDPRAVDGTVCGCRACRLHARHKRFATATAADRHRAHPGCRCRVVRATVERRRWRAWFVRPNGSTRKVVDLRRAKPARRR